jgi:hypothetical protein
MCSVRVVVVSSKFYSPSFCPTLILQLGFVPFGIKTAVLITAALIHRDKYIVEA